MRSEHRREGRNVIFLIFHTHFSFSPFIERKKRKINEKETEKILLGICEKRKKTFSGSAKNYCKKYYRTWGREGVNFVVKLMGYFHKGKLPQASPTPSHIRFLKIFHQFFHILLYVILGFFIIFFFFYSSYKEICVFLLPM